MATRTELRDTISDAIKKLAEDTPDANTYEGQRTQAEAAKALAETLQALGITLPSDRG